MFRSSTALRAAVIGVATCFVIWLASCVGDDADSSTLTGKDSGADGTTRTPDGATPDSSTGDDSGPADAGADANADADAEPPRCSADGGWGTPSVVAELNDSSSRNHGARLSADELVVYWSSDRFRDGGTGGYPGFDIFTGTRTTPNGTFTGIRRLPISNPDWDVPEMSPSETQDGLRLYFEAYKPGRSIWFGTRGSKLSDYSTPQAVSAVNGGGENGTPYVLPNESALYFTSSRGGGLGSFDVYRATMNGGIVTQVDPLAAPVSSANAELFVTATPDDLTLYFGSSRDNGGYALDIFVATRANTSSAFGSVTKLPPSINAHTGGVTAVYPDFVTADGCILYFTKTLAGKEQIWRVRRN